MAIPRGNSSNQSNLSVISFFFWLAHDNKLVGALQTLTSVYSRSYSCLLLGYYIPLYVLSALFIDHATSDPLTNLKALWL